MELDNLSAKRENAATSTEVVSRFDDGGDVATRWNAAVVVLDVRVVV